MRARAPRWLLLASSLAAAIACGSSAELAPAPAPARAEAPAARPTQVPIDSPERDAAIERVADQLMARATASEPSVSELLRQLAVDVDGRLAGYENRLKRRASLVRKLHKLLIEHPDWQPHEIVVNDVLRYTIEVNDRPPGRHAEAIRTTFARLEAAGHIVARVKNYWPRGDNYSGVNTVMVAPDGLQWELQFHTPESFRLKMRDHHLYEEMREVATPAARKRQIYVQMTTPWDSVPIPQHMLESKSLHRKEEIIVQAAP
jgi:hypothetical protein